jgi:hypothetical protein
VRGIGGKPWWLRGSLLARKVHVQAQAMAAGGGASSFRILHDARSFERKGTLVSAPNLPHLFGRFTAILKEHDHLGHTLGRLRKMCGSLEAGLPIVERELAPERLFEELHADLARHFAAEESAEYFGVVVEEAPSLGPEIASLQAEHVSMLLTIEQLRAVASAAQGLASLPQSTRSLIADLERHERAESVLLRQLFSQ